jgi:VanZ family protein
MLVGILLAGLWPLDFFPKNTVFWLKDRNGLSFKGKDIGGRFSAGGVALIPEQLAYPRQQSSTIELWLRPAGEPDGCRHRIVDFFDESKKEKLLIGQWKESFLVHWPVSGPGAGGQEKEIWVDRSLSAGKTRFATVTSDERGAAIYLEGVPAGRFPGVSLPAVDGSSSILIGNSLEATCSWSGELYGLAFYDHSLTEAEVLQSYQWWTHGTGLPHPFKDSLIALYTFNERSGTRANNAMGANNRLLIPPRLQFKKRILVPLPVYGETGIPEIKDAIINVVGFIPFSIFLVLWLIRSRQWQPRRAYLAAIGLGILVSLTIELLQIYLPSRESSQADLVCNGIGVVLGVVAVHYSGRTASRRKQLTAECAENAEKKQISHRAHREHREVSVDRQTEIA